ncbi:hypothetical protein H6G54_23280 [Anabaena cylindrica FACHB-243]|uniref:Uncharacterized protein n=1 Tax=Anabaena cylindrica (strain ATCC 27899 / PCC 7122) TaxID=272123 RepID=K9ZJZ2_ANACC|nr:MULTISPECIES: hypothetical protein [Anabaena]AFZ59089.1 hypothetical protein Anacy_3702 [Anabaena cylindrica PCC 7122]MBD2420572.1 hypothetical protein [Anabaena cylindrica FACHB-243]MBY5284437.1 hypothetical protein [Anabaena sp. CCAP 1446/1C]MBY5308998.1 hypothetical protein [Anabaena sp. CCAP 1446/1C]MCM2408530.1 hypothetical protein [Anabaena sp. CCAP 1446/1C]
MKKSLLVKIATIVLFSFGSLSVIAGSFLLTKAASKTETAQIITDASRYPEIRNQNWSDIEPIKHFPLTIPDDAKAVRMAYSLGLMQGSSFLQIRFQQPPEQIQKLLSKYSKIASHQYQGGDTNDHSQQANGVPTTFFYTGESKTEAFPNTYEILVLKAQAQGQPGFKWNHGKSYGVAIDSSASEIVYWLEKW